MKRLHGIPEHAGETGSRYTKRGEGVTGDLIKKLKMGISKSFETDGTPERRRDKVLYMSKSTGYSAYADITTDREIHLRNFMPPSFLHNHTTTRKLMIEQVLSTFSEVIFIE